MLKLNAMGWVALFLAIIGALNWGLVGAFNGFNLVSTIFGEMSPLARLVYILVGLSAIYLLVEAVGMFRVHYRETHRHQPA